jgi:hypothetical protein
MPGKCSDSFELPDLIFIFAWTGNEPSPREDSALRRVEKMPFPNDKKRMVLSRRESPMEPTKPKLPRVAHQQHAVLALQSMQKLVHLFRAGEARFVQDI